MGLDFAPEMLADAERRRREDARGQTVARIEWVEGDAMDLPFEDSSFDAATIGYGLRSLPHLRFRFPSEYQGLRALDGAGGPREYSCDNEKWS